MYLHHPFLWNLILLIEDSCIKYKALHNLERLMIGDFLANKNYIVTRQADIVTFLPLSHSLQTFTVTVTEAVLDHCLHNDLLFLLHHTSVSVYDLKSQSWRDKIIMIADKLVSIKVNDHVMVILDTTNTLHIFNLRGISPTLYINVWILMIFCSGLLSSSNTPDDSVSFLLPFSACVSSYPSVILNRTSMTIFNYNLNQCFLYSLWPRNK